MKPPVSVLEESVDFLIGYGELAARLATPKLGGTDLGELLDVLEALTAASDDHKRSVRALGDVVAFFVAKTNRPLLARTSFEIIQLAEFSAGEEHAAPLWDAETFDRDLRDALAARNATAASDAFRTLAQSFERRSPAV